MRPVAPPGPKNLRVPLSGWATMYATPALPRTSTAAPNQASTLAASSGRKRRSRGALPRVSTHRTLGRRPRARPDPRGGRTSAGARVDPLPGDEERELAPFVVLADMGGGGAVGGIALERDRA